MYSLSELNDFLRFSRVYCAEHLAWFSPAVYRCEICLTEQVPIVAIDLNLKIYFNPQYVQQLLDKYSRNDALARIAYLWIHEISHILREHAERAIEINANPELWNLACDLEINDAKWEGLIAPDNFHLIKPKDLSLSNGQIAEHYYDILNQRNNCDSDCDCDLNSQHTNDDGSGAHGQPRKWEVSSESESSNAIDSIELKIIRTQVAKSMKNQEVNIKGSLPAGWSRWIEDELTSKTNWRKILRHKLKLAINSSLMGKLDYTFKKPSRRQSTFAPLFLPSLSGDNEINISVVVDTSGSMSSKQLGQATSEVCKILETFRRPVKIIPCDAKVYEIIEIRSAKDYIKLKELKGGGGTDMVLAIEEVLKMKPLPDVILVLTDGYTDYPMSKYHTPVIFGILQYDNTLVPVPPLWEKDSTVRINLTV